MTQSSTAYFPDPHQDTFSKTILGFWIYIMTDCLIFATLFTSYGVLHKSNFGGPTTHDLFTLTTPLIETFVLLVSSFTCGLALLSARRNARYQIIGWFIVSFVLGLTFVILEINEFAHLVHEGNSWEKSAFLSSFFTLVGTHGFHVSIGLFWMVVLIGQILWSGINTDTFRRLVCFNMFWHFLDLVWIFIFTFVYLMGVI
jgi:cytochrome o ubiquinol oxidase subunit 3